MREIKFRGLREGINDWVYGDLIHYNELTSIRFYTTLYGGEEYIVNPESVGQFTGLPPDKNGNLAFKDDVLKVSILREDGRQEEGVLKIVWDDFAFCLESISGNIGDCWLSILSENIVGQISEYEVIGNIHQNPELI